MRYAITIVVLSVAGSLFSSCSRDYDVDLPAHEPKLVVECYLEDGQPLRALVTESTALLDSNMIPPVITDATVTITYGGHTDTLEQYVYFDSIRNRVYNYGSNTIVRADYTPGATYRIDVRDGKGRHAFGTAYFLPPVAIDSIAALYNNEGEASLLTYFTDAAAVKNYFRLVIKRNARNDSIQQNRYFSDDLATNSGTMVIRSGYRYQPGDSVHAALYHITQDYYQYLNTSENARSALVNPFAASGEVVSNIQGGLGVFTALSFTQKSVRIP